MDVNSALNSIKGEAAKSEAVVPTVKLLFLDLDEPVDNDLDDE